MTASLAIRVIHTLWQKPELQTVKTIITCDWGGP